VFCGPALVVFWACLSGSLSHNLSVTPKKKNSSDPEGLGLSPELATMAATTRPIVLFSFSLFTGAGEQRYIHAAVHLGALNWLCWEGYYRTVVSYLASGMTAAGMDYILF
jgi:hypothetical protein